MKKKIKDLTSEEYREWELKNCSGTDCLGCPFKYVNCNIMWVNHKDMYSNKFLDQEVDIPSPHILDKEEHDYLRAVCKPYKVKFITLNQWVRNIYYLKIVVEDKITSTGRGVLELPFFKKDTMYKGMKLGKEYTIEELELDKEWNND